MAPLIDLCQVETRITPFDTVAVVVGIEGPKHVNVNGSNNCVVTTISLDDGTTRKQVEIELWNWDSIRVSAIRNLDIVHIRDGIIKKKKDDEYNNNTIRLVLHGKNGHVRSVVLGGVDNDELDKKIKKAMKWKYEEFKIVSRLCEIGEIWNHDEQVRHGNGVGLNQNVHHHHHIKNKNKKSLKTIKEGGKKGLTEIENVKIEKVYVQVLEKEGMKNGEEEMDIEKWCWYGCNMCGAITTSINHHHHHHHHHERCKGCGGGMEWRFSDVLMRVNTNDGKFILKMEGQDVSKSLLFGMTANDVMKKKESGEWVKTVLRALQTDATLFTIAVSKQSNTNHVPIRIHSVYIM